MWDRDDKKFDEVYDLLETIGEGSMGSVCKVRKKSSGQIYALKTIIVNRISSSMRNELMNEINILRGLDHPNIVRVHAVFREKRQIYVVMELCDGGDLYDRTYTESRAVRIVKKIVGALLYCHSNNVIHRDLKFENILFESTAPDAEVKLIDFGLSKVYTSGDKLKQAVGTVYSMAPEVLEGDYTEQADMWSIGVLTYMLLSGDMPFDGMDETTILKKVRRGRYRFGGQKWSHISPEAKSFIENLLRYSPTRRWTAQQAMESDWFKLRAADKVLEDQTAPAILDSIQRFGNYSRMKKTALMVMAHQISSRDAKALRDAFNAVDTANSGTISVAELEAVMQKHTPQLLKEDRVHKMFAGVDQDQSGKIHYLEFLAATLETQAMMREENLEEAFDRLDADNTGFISKENLKNILGNDYDEGLVDQMIAEADLKKNGQIDFEEFLAMMRTSTASDSLALLQGSDKIEDA